MAVVKIVKTTTPAHLAAARTLIEEYAAVLGVDLCFQNFAEELETLREMYGPPGGCLLLAQDGPEFLGCVAIRRREQGVCEMKRLYVKPAHRGHGLGRRLAESAIECARALGYQYIVLDTLASMHAARALYESFGFREIDGYYSNPLDGVHYLALEIGQPPEAPP